jgi:riboflavin transporter FmnP
MGQTDKVRQTTTRSKTQTMTGIALFSALALVLNLTHVQVPAPYLPFLIYEIWEIPIVACLLIFGLSASLIASLINSLVLILVNPGALAAGPLYNLIAVAVTLFAISLGHRISSGMKVSLPVEIALSTGLSILVRTSVMSIVNYVLLPFPAPLGFSTPDSYVVTILPVIAFFNATIALYTVPLGYASVKAIIRRIHFRMAYPLPASVVKK